MTRIKRALPLFSLPLLALLLHPEGAAGQERKPSAPATIFLETLKSTLASPFLKKAKLGLYIQNLRTGEVLSALNAEEPLIPASNTKLVSTAAALYHLGPDYRFRTLLAIPKDSKKGGKIQGDLFLKGFGDPRLSTRDLNVFADQLVLKGITEISGDLVIDDSFFDAKTDPPGYEEKPEVQSTYRAPISATSLNFNAIGVHVFPGEKAGDKARLAADPRGGYLIVEGEVATTAKKTKLSVECEEDKDKLRCKATGSIALSHPGSASWRRVPNPPMYLGYTLSGILKEHGISLKGKIKSGKLPEDAQSLYVHTSEELGVLVRYINKSSNNFMAEMVLKTLGAEYKGAPGTSAAGLEAVRDYLADIGLPRGSYKISNASGLWGETRFSASQMVKILDAAAKDSRLAPDFMASLAIAGADGTIRSRMKGTSAERALRAKTGTLDEVICLSGYVRLNNADLVGFSVLLNDVSGYAGPAKELQNEIGVAIADYLIALDPAAAFPTRKLDATGAPEEDGE
jgi:serine-type D-Ala-D-Ala carboxypeptidase/endopeptidase (penicillin-binding protein 4)